MNNNTKKAFTLIELMLAVAFIGTLLLSVAMLAMQLVNMYTKGVAMRSINAIGGDIADDLKQTITSSTEWSENETSPFNPIDGGSGFNKDAIEKARAKYYAYDDRGYGVFCTNTYTYVFNYQPAMLKYRDGKFDDGNYLKIKNEDTGEELPYGLARVKDPSAVLCQSAEKARKNATSNAFFSDGHKGVAGDYTVTVKSQDLTVLLDGKDSNDGSDLELYDFSVMHATRTSLTDQSLFSISFVLGTMRGGINVMSSSNYCSQKAQEGLDAETKAAQEAMANVGMSYCAVNRFEVTVRQTGNADI